MKMKQWTRAILVAILSSMFFGQLVPLTAWAEDAATIRLTGQHNRITEPIGQLETVTLDRVIDGDTIAFVIDGRSEKVRLIGMDTPESVHPDANKNTPYGDEAKKYVEEFFKEHKGKAIQLEYDVSKYDRYNRILAYVWIDGKMLNETLLSEGYAQLATYPPNTRYVEQFQKAQTAARQAERGFWNGNAVAFDKETTKTKAVTEQQVESKVQEAPQPPVEPAPVQAAYIGNANSHKFHRPGCASVAKMAEHNKVSLSSREEAINGGYDPCKRCHP